MADTNGIVRDDEGEFLLTESAFHLPKWVTPRAAVRRLYLRHGMPVFILDAWTDVYMNLLYVRTHVCENEERRNEVMCVCMYVCTYVHVSRLAAFF